MIIKSEQQGLNIRIFFQYHILFAYDAVVGVIIRRVLGNCVYKV